MVLITSSNHLQALFIREIASYAKSHNTIVAVANTDFCVFEIPGVIFTDSIVRRKQFLQVITIYRIYSCFHMNRLQLLFYVYLQGNDFIKARDKEKKQQLMSHVTYIQQHPPSDITFYDEKYGNVDLTQIDQQYSLTNVVPYPYSLITTDVDEIESLVDEGISEGSIHHLWSNDRIVATCMLHFRRSLYRAWI